MHWLVLKATLIDSSHIEESLFTIICYIISISVSDGATNRSHLNIEGS